MMTTQTIKRSVLAGLMVLSMGARADVNSDFHGSVCVAENSETDSFLGHTIFGIHNTTDTDLATVWCPLTVTRDKGPYLAESFYTSVHIYQRNANIPFSCTFFELGEDGWPHWSWTMSATDPTQSSDGGFVLDVQDGQGWPYVNVWRCTIPPQTEEGAYSHVTSFNISWVAPQ